MTERSLSAYDRRLAAHREIPFETWSDWRFQQRASLSRAKNLAQFFPAIDPVSVSQAEAWESRGFRFQLTPHELSLIARDEVGRPVQSDPIWRQFFPAFESVLERPLLRRLDEYTPERENWEIDGEMLTPIAQHKYDDRVIVYAADICLSYCTYCLRSLQSTAEEEAHGGARRHWAATLDKLRERPEVHEVILSGGDPLVYDNGTLRGMLSDLRAIKTIRSIRVHSRAFTQNPYRIDDELCAILSEHEVTAMAVHVVHPNELSTELFEAIDRVRAARPRMQFLAQIPLIRGLNDDAEVLRALFEGLYYGGVKPYYLLHSMPNIPMAAQQRTSVRKGARLLAELGRKISHPAIPEYIILHRTGKRTVPQEIGGTSEFIYETAEDGHPRIRFLTWKGTWETYVDGVE